MDYLFALCKIKGGEGGVPTFVTVRYIEGVGGVSKRNSRMIKRVARELLNRWCEIPVIEPAASGSDTNQPLRHGDAVTNDE